MSIRNFLNSAALALLLTLSALPARAGIPTFDSLLNLLSGANFITANAAWVQQATDMVQTLQKYQKQIEQMKSMTDKLDGIRNLGTILNDPAISAALPPEMRNMVSMMANPSSMTTDPAAMQSILSSFGINVSAVNPDLGKSAADAMGKAQSVLTASLARQRQLQQLAQRADTSADAKESMDLVNRSVLEAANINNQMMQTMATFEAAKQAEVLRKTARSQAFMDAVKEGSSGPLTGLVR